MEEDSLEYFYILAINEYKKWLKIVVTPIKNDKPLYLAKFKNGIIENGIIIQKNKSCTVFILTS
jgi:hypothetical protein